MQIGNNVFIVTGGASGLGGATTRMLAANGAKVVIADVQADRGEALARELGNARFVKCDVASEADGQAAVGRALAMGRAARTRQLRRHRDRREGGRQGRSACARILRARDRAST